MKKEMIVTGVIAGSNLRRKILAGVVLAFVLFGGALEAHAFTGEKYAKEAKITIEKARTAALKAFPGKIVSEELEKERGGSGLRYSFDIRRGNIVHEVGVDAKTGKILENSVEGPHAD